MTIERWNAIQVGDILETRGTHQWKTFWVVGVEPREEINVLTLSRHRKKFKTADCVWYFATNGKQVVV